MMTWQVAEKASLLLSSMGAWKLAPPCSFEDAACPDIRQITLCCVCSTPTDGTHFGVYSCRACAAFFRRSVAMNKKYICRKGGDRCVNHHSSPGGFCRKCRFRKCIEVGMKAECVQSKGAAAKETTAESSSEAKAEGQETHSPSIHLQNPSTSSEDPKFIDDIYNNYRKLCDLRRELEITKFPCSSGAPQSQYAGLRRCTAAELSQIYLSHLPPTMEFLNESFPDFKRMEENYRWPIFQSFMAIFWRMGNAHRTMQYVPPDKYKTQNVLTETCYVDLDEPEIFISQIPNCGLLKDELMRSMKECMGTSRLKMMDLMRELEISDQEYAALIGLAVWNQTNGSYPDQQVARTIRGRIFDDLRIHYNSRNIENYALRLGQLMCLFNAIMFAAARMRENVVLLELCQAFEEESIIYSFYKNCSIVG